MIEDDKFTGSTNSMKYVSTPGIDKQICAIPGVVERREIKTIRILCLIRYLPKQTMQSNKIYKYISFVTCKD